MTLPESMQAVQLESPGGPLVVRRRPIPSPGPGQVLVRMAAAPVNPSDLGFLLKATDSLPVVPGIEGSGTVVAAGSGLLPRWLVGKRVACVAEPGSGGTWAEYVVATASTCFPLKRTITLEQGATLLVNPLTALAMLQMIERERRRAVVSTAAASALGRMLLSLGQRRRLPIICVVRRKEQADLLRTLGAEHVLDSTDADFVERLSVLARRLRATLLLDAVAGSMTHRLLEAAPAGSTILAYANLSQEACSVPADVLINEDKRLVGFHLANWAKKQGLIQSAQFIRRAQQLLKTDLKTTIRCRMALSEAQRALELYVGDMTSGKVLLVPGSSEIPVDPRPDPVDEAP